ncbi:MAG TPA: hypothetical protein VE817_01550 [Candidatus Acidoferrum sp.]|nr:hypothetical protein [Candidatus Acidoferrum sp.]
MTPLLIAAAGLGALIAGGLVLRSFGPAYRIGRLLTTAPEVTIAEANAIAAEGRAAYVRVAGRIDADDEFEDDAHRPLVFRRVRLEVRTGRAWRPFEDHRRSVPFVVNEGLDSIGVDVDALDAGLIVVPRESVGRAADMPDRAPDGVAADTPVRARVDQVSSVEHAIVVGYPVAVAPPDGPRADTPPVVNAQLTAGRGRPLILTVLEPPEAMRILAGGDATRTRLAAGLLGAGAILILGAVAWAAVTALLPAIVSVVPGAAGLVTQVLAASAAPSIEEGGDPRSNGQGPGLVGTPGLAILGVILIAVAAIVVTTIYVRLSSPPRTTRQSSSPTRRRRR